MSGMTSTEQRSDVDRIVVEEGLTAAQAQGLRDTAASWAMEGQILTLDELRGCAQIASGTITVEEYRRRFGV